MAEYMEREVDLDDEIYRVSDFVLLPEGDYDFTVTGFERARHEGSEKLPPCKKAIVTLTIDAPEGKASIKHNLFLHQRCEGLLSQFFIGIGLKKHGEPLKMDWTRVAGSAGRCKIGVRSWVDKDGNTRESNEVKKFYDPQVTSQTAAPAAAPRTAPAQQSAVGGVFTPGKF